MSQKGRRGFASGVDKRVSLEEAVSGLPRGATIATGGLGLSRKPIQLVNELTRQGIGSLTAVTLAGALDIELLVKAGQLERVRASIVVLDSLGLGPFFRRSVENGDIRVIEETEFSFVTGLRATVAGLPFLPGHSIRGTDLRDVRPDIRLTVCPYTSAELVAWPAIPIDWAFLHVAQADVAGNVVIGLQPGVDRLLAIAAKRTIVTAESVTDSLSGSMSVDIVGRHVDAVIEAPRGSGPCSSATGTPPDIPWIMEFLEDA